VDFSGVHINEKAIKLVTLSNNGKFSMDYKFDHNLHRNSMVALTGLEKSQGTIRKGKAHEDDDDDDGGGGGGLSNGV